MPPYDVPNRSSDGDVIIEISSDEDDDFNITEHTAQIGDSKIYRRSINMVELSLDNITYSPITRAAKNHTFFKSSLSKQRTTILSNVSTKISPGELNAFMGPSGSGKTTLLSVCADLVPEPIKDGCIKVNGEEGSVPKRLVGVVWQDDLLLSNLTVKETVRFAARLKSSQSDEEVDRLVEDTLSRLGLNQVQNSLIGVPGGSGRSRGISGGERKRVAVAVELVARPSVLLLDEPTSGLDASTAYQLMVTLKELASMGHAIAVVIHQPRTEIFNMFDNLLLLSKGKPIYEGKPAGARHFLESCPGVKSLPPETGKADWIMDTINEDESRKDGGQLPSLWKDYSSELRKETPPPQNRLGESNSLRHRATTATKVHGEQRMVRTLSSLAVLEREPKYLTSFSTQLRLLFIRASRQQRGQRITRVAFLLMICWVSFICFAWGRMPDTTTYVYGKVSLLFFLIIAQSNSVVTSTLLIFSKERKLLSRERAKKMYGVLPYFIAATLSDMINSILFPTLTGIIVYWVCGFRQTASAFFTFVLALYLSLSTAQSTGLFFSVAIPNTTIALMLAPSLTLWLMILGGFYIPYKLIHPALRWATWISFCRYGFSAFVINEFGDRDIPCDGQYDSQEECPFPGSAVIASYDIDGAWSNVWLNVSMLVAIQVFLRLATYCLLLRSK